MDLADARTQWIDAGLRGLRREGVEAVRVERLATLMTITLAADGRLERAMRDWARNDADVAGALAEIDGKRLRHVADLLVATGEPPADAKLRALRLSIADRAFRHVGRSAGTARRGRRLRRARRSADALSVRLASPHFHAMPRPPQRTGITLMQLRRRDLLAAAAILAAAPALAQGGDLENTIYLDTKDGRVTIRLRPDLAPKHVAQIKTLARQGFYDNIVFHRVIEGFMAQTGDPTGTGMGGSKLPNLPAEFSKESFKRGTVGMARSSDPNSANSQFFICFGDASFLNNNYTIVGEVTAGMEVVDKIKKGSQANNGQVSNPDKIVKMKVAADK